MNVYIGNVILNSFDFFFLYKLFIPSLYRVMDSWWSSKYNLQSVYESTFTLPEVCVIEEFIERILQLSPHITDVAFWLLLTFIITQKTLFICKYQ